MTNSDMTSMDASRQPIVTVKNGEVFADSRDVATAFGKRHTEVLRAIRDLIIKEPELGQRNFASFKISDLTGESTSHYDMDRRGFTLLAMGFTGEKALRWKLKYIEAFELMEAQLLKQSTLAKIDYTDPSVILGCVQALQSQVAEKDEVIAEMKPKVEALDRIAEAYGSHNRTNAAKMLQVSPQALIRWMRTNGWTYRRPGDPDDIGYQSKIAAGLLEHKINTGLREDGTSWTSTQVRVTAKGMTVLAQAFPPAMKRA